jgi:4-carboxymuconolactone decarboxylase
MKHRIFGSRTLNAVNQQDEGIAPMKTVLVAVMFMSLLAPLHAQTGKGGSAASEPTLAISRQSSRPPSMGAPENFTGSVKVDFLFAAEEPQRASGAYVSFAPGARTAWHTHPLGQTLVVTAGVGQIQRWGGPIEKIQPGDVVRIPPGVKHWHGAAPDSAMTHLAVQERLDGKTVDWLEKVSDEQAMPATLPAAKAISAAAQPSRAQMLFGDVAPKLAELTDNVLFGDVWARPGLSPRDRSLVTVSALIAMNRPDQLRSHMALARQNGLTQEELVEALTHLAFYAGWPSAVTAATVAKEVFAQPKP